MSQKQIDLNVGGVPYTTTLSTLSREPESMLGRMFADCWHFDDVTNVTLSGDDRSEHHVATTFIDADGTHFRYILNYLRRGDQVYLPNNLELLDELIVEANYFQLQGLTRLIDQKLAILRPSPPPPPTARLDAPIMGWVPMVGQLVKWRPDAIEGFWRSVVVAVASFHYQGAQAEAVCGFMHKTKYLPDDMEVFFLRCVSCRASTRVGEPWRYELDSLKSIKSVMPALTMHITAAPAAMNHIISSDCVSVSWSSTMSLHVSKSAIMPA